MRFTAVLCERPPDVGNSFKRRVRDNHSCAEAISLLRNNRVVILSAGTGKPVLHTTDPAACLRSKLKRMSY